ncbi:MAG: DUF2325 domain-containing protein [Thermosulfidibacteraceae bacterium]|jgi:phosphoglycerate dehydrogenase-like enzyme
MCVALIGGMDRLKHHYLEEAKRMNVTLKVFTKLEKNVEKRIGKVDGVIIFTNKVSHELKDTLKKLKIECPCILCHSCGVSSLRKCLESLQKQYSPQPNNNSQMKYIISTENYDISS